VRALITALRTEHGCEEVFVLSTCLRTEILTVGGEGVAQALARVTGLDETEFLPAMREWESPGEVAEHLFRVASGLESIALGETQVLGQVKEAHQAALALQALGPVLSQLVERALAVGGEVRCKTTLGTGIVSIPSLAAHMARHALGSIEGARAVIIGTGKMAMLAARHLGEAGAQLVVVSRRDRARAESLVAEAGGEAGEFSPDLAFCRGADLILCATNATDVIIDPVNLAGIMEGSRQTPLLLVDLCVPRAIDPAAAEVPGCRLINLDSMRTRCEAARRRREEALAQAEPLIRRAVGEFEAWWSARSVAPTIRALLSRLERLRLAELNRVIGKERAGEEKVEILTRALMTKIAHGAISHLRRSAAEGDAERTVALVHEIFQLGHEG
jgi:glutamyl-tRNA reductase